MSACRHDLFQHTERNFLIAHDGDLTASFNLFFPYQRLPCREPFQGLVQAWNNVFFASGNLLKLRHAITFNGDGFLRYRDLDRLSGLLFSH